MEFETTINKGVLQLLYRRAEGRWTGASTLTGSDYPSTIMFELVLVLGTVEPSMGDRKLGLATPRLILITDRFRGNTVFVFSDKVVRDCAVAVCSIRL